MIETIRTGLPISIVMAAHFALIFVRLFFAQAPANEALGSGLPTEAQAAAADPVAVELSRYAPTADYREIGDFLLAYDGSRRCPRWALEKIDRRTVQRSSDHERPAFHADPDIPPAFAATNADYDMSGYDRGHLVCAENMDYSAKAFDATFVLSNTVPQQPNCNRGVWKALESDVRRLALADGIECVYVLTAPAWKPSDPIQARAARWSHVRVRCVGRHQVWVPTHLVKAALLKHADGGWEMQSWIVPNIEDCRPKPEAYKASVDDLEALIGLDLWQNVPGGERLEVDP